MIIDRHTITEISSIKLKLIALRENIKKKFYKRILPRDYPFSVGKGYAEFSYLTFISNICFCAMNFVMTQNLINSLNSGISRNSGLALSAGLNWAIKEGLGQIGKNNH